MSTTTPLTDAINALTTYANETTGSSDTDLSSAVATLIAGYGGSSETAVTGSFTVNSETTSQYNITTTTEIGFVPSEFYVYVAALESTTTQYSLVFSMFTSVESYYLRGYWRYTNTTGTVGGASSAGYWSDTGTGYPNYNSSTGVIGIKAQSACKLVPGTTYYWKAVK